VIALFKPHRMTLAVVFAIVLVIGALGVITPLLGARAIDEGIFAPTGVDLTLLLELCGVLLVLTLARGALQLWQTFLTARVGQNVLRDIRTKLFEHLQSLSLRFFTGTRTGEIQSRLQNDVGGLQTVVSDTAATYVSNIVALVSTIIAMLLLSWQLTVVSVLVLPLFIWATGGVGKWRRRVTARTQESLADMSAITEESLSVSGVLLAKSHGQQRNAADTYRTASTRLAGLLVKQQMISRGFFIVITTFFSLMPLAVYLTTAWVNGSNPGAISVGVLAVFTGLQTALFFPLGQLLQSSTEVSSSLALFSRIFAYLDEVPDIVDAPDAVALPKPVQGRIELDGVRFSYDPKPAKGEAVYALQGVDLTIEPGQLAAFVGPSGAGKTTISYLVPRLYEVTSGAVRIDGHDVREVTLESLADTIGMVTQESYLFHATIRDNLTYARPDATEAQIEAAARAAQIHDRIMSFDEGYDTMVGERGYRLSGGEKQRLAIARVILKDPRVLILDEATSALDTTNERLVQAALRPLMEGRTTIAIAHRLSTIRSADVIFAVKDGRVVERGTHEELLERGGVYADLYDQQFGGGAVEARCDDGIILSDGHVVPMPTSGRSEAEDGTEPRPSGAPRGGGRLDDAARAASSMTMG
jgi:ATP-binding cassette subfamily B protein